MTKTPSPKHAPLKSLRSLLSLLSLLSLISITLPAAPKNSIKAPTSPLSEKTVVSKIRNTFEASEFDKSPVGVWIESIDRGRVLYSKAPDTPFSPASNVKIITSAAALSLFGPDYRYRTTITYIGEIKDQILNGDLVVVGTGDPTIGSEDFKETPMTTIEGWVSEIKAKGIRRITGNIIGDDNKFSDELIPSGWKDNYLTSPYAAQASALSLGGNCIKIVFEPGHAPGSPAQIQLSPDTSYVVFEGTVKTVAAGQKTTIGFTRLPGTNRVQIRGTRSMKKENRYDYTTIHNPTLYTVTVLSEALRKAGIQVDGKPIDIDDLPETPKEYSKDVIYERLSSPLSEILPLVNKESDNFYADQLFMSIGAREFQSAGWTESATATQRWLRSVFIDPKGLVMVDGSGLSSENRTTVRQLTGVLKYIHHHPDVKIFVDSLSVAGEDGTLRKRMTGTKAEGRVHAKTGYIKGVRALSGYVVTLKGETIVFSFLLNNAERIGSGFKIMTDQALLDLVYME